MPCEKPTQVVGAVLEFTCQAGHTYTLRFEGEQIEAAAGDMLWPGSRPCDCSLEPAAAPTPSTAPLVDGRVNYAAAKTIEPPVASDEEAFDPLLQEDLVMPWGKHRGEKLCDIDTGYLQWALENMDRLAPTYKEEIRNQLALRGGRGVSRTRR